MEEVIKDPSYDRTQINSNPVWELAFSLSEIMNDEAPFGWVKYIATAECLLRLYDITRVNENL